MINKQTNKVLDGAACSPNLLSAAMKLCGKLRIIHGLDEYKAVWHVAQIHRGPYRGPKYDQELEALEAEIEASILSENSGI